MRAVPRGGRRGGSHDLPDIQRRNSRAAAGRRAERAGLSLAGRRRAAPAAGGICGGGSGGGVSKEFVLQKVGKEAEARRQADAELQKQINENKDSITTVSESVKTKIDDAPKDGQFYGRQNGLWAAGNVNIEEI